MFFRVQFPLDKKIKTQQIITDAWITIVQKSEVSEHFLKEVSPSLHLFYKNIQFKKTVILLHFKITRFLTYHIL